MQPAESVFCLIIIGLFFVDFVSCLVTLSADKEGVCYVKIRSPRTRTKWYTVATNKLCGKKKCLIKKSKIEKYTVSTNQLACCNGWGYIEDECVPLCSTGCVGGRCIAPDVCHCDPPTYLSPGKNNTCITPKCDPECINGICKNNHCECLDRYVKLNSTTCQPQCGEGYRNEGADLSCRPYCGDCTHGNCTSPNTCICLEGFEKGANGSCTPVCESCDNGTCDGVNKCVCNDGYSFDKETESCVPRCEGCSGSCAAPGICRCDDGYKEVDGSCQPVCDPCVNGSCSEPGVCSCGPGLVLRGGACVVGLDGCGGLCRGTCVGNECTEGGTCIRITSETRKVPDGNTTIKGRRKCGVNKWCPVTKTILKYKEVLRHECCNGWDYEPDDTCRPVCRYGCSNGQCVGADQCQCTPPLILQNNSHCVLPTCEPACVNARCSAPNNCQCNPDFVKYNSTHCAPNCLNGFHNDPDTLECRPNCDSPCINGICIGLNTCSCIEGYKLEDADGFKCVPTCEPLCQNSTCVAPNICSCHEGFKRESAWKCTPICDDCNHGTCKAPGVCECDEGYSKSGDKCAPVCKTGCLNGFCSAPDTCTCESGYMSQNSSCVPFCEPSCVNSTCTSANVCSCLEGYETAENSWTCKPRCENCQNGECVAPGQCQCNTGYSFQESKCVPYCTKECANGFCSEPDVCTCHLGYIANKTDNFSCHPVCDPKCENAFCESPNKCSCFPGYEAVDLNWSCSPKCQKTCRNSLCAAPDKCSCNEGYLRNDTDPSACYKPCRGLCEMGTCTDHGICLCNSGYELVNDTCIAVTLIDCRLCEGNCSDSVCQCASGMPCSEAAQPLSMAGLEKTWLIFSAVCLLLLTLLCVVIERTWRRRRLANAKTESPAANETLYSSVIYTRPDGLLPRCPTGDCELEPSSAPDLEEGRVLLTPNTTADNS